MEKYILDFERPLTDLENKIQEMKDYSLNEDIDLREEISKLEEKAMKLSREIFEIESLAESAVSPPSAATLY